MPKAASRPAALFRTLRRWLDDVPIEDPIERRNAPTLQLILIAFGLVVPVVAALRWSQKWAIVDVDLGGELIGLARVGLAWICLYFVRNGSFRLAVGLFIAGDLAGLAFGYASYGLRAQLPTQIVHAFPLVLGGLLLGRRALWWIAPALAAIAAAGAARDILGAGPLPILRVEAWSNLLAALLGFGGIAIVLDRAVSALRESLDTATRRGHELARARDRLESEVVERERTQAQLTHALKMEAIGRIASGIAHDFNNVLGLVLGYAGRARDVTDPVAVKSLDGIRAAARRGAQVAQRLLNLGRSEPSYRERVDVAELLDAVKPLLLQVFDTRVQTTITLEAAALPVLVDRAGFELALLNLAANARDAMPDGGRFDVHAGPAGDGRVCIRLRDSGSGMPPEVVARMFEPFYTTKPRGAGTGLGLGEVRRFVAEAGGSIDVDSAPGAGTTLRIELPLAGPP